MELSHAREMAETLLEKYGVGVTVNFVDTMAYLGVARFYLGIPTEMRLSKRYVLAADEKEVRGTVLHEVAHFLAGASAGHGDAWKAICRRIGAAPEAKCGTISDETMQAMHKWTLTCRKCGGKVYRNRLTKAARFGIHPGCGREGTFIIHKNY